MRLRRRRQLKSLTAKVATIESEVSETRRVVDAIRRKIEGLDSLVRELHADSWNVNALRAEAIQSVILAETARVQQLVIRLNDDSSQAAMGRHEDLRTLLGQNHEGLVGLVSQNHKDLVGLVSQNHADMWDANERRALSLADVVVLSITPRIEAMKQDLLALVGEKAVEVFREQSNGQ